MPVYPWSENPPVRSACEATDARLSSLPMARKRLAENRTPVKNGKVEVKSVDAKAWSHALRIADGDAKRLVRLSRTEVLVLRRPQG